MFRTHGRPRFILIVFRVALCAASFALNDQTLQAQRVTQSQIFISLVDPEGVPVADLKASEVNITEDGAACQVVQVEPIQWPSKLQLLIDNGQATTNPINSLRDGLRDLLNEIPDGVEMSMYTTAPQPRPIVRPTTEKEKLISGIGLIAPDNGAGAFFDALSEAATRIDRDKTPHFPVILMVGSTLGRSEARDRDFQRLQENIINHAAAVHIIVVARGGGTSGGVAQTEIGLAVTKLSGGRYENIATTTRLATLLPELGKKIAQSHRRQSHQHRITYQCPANKNQTPQTGASVTRPGSPIFTRNGHIP